MIIIHFDGGCSPNPGGPMTYGYIIEVVCDELPNVVEKRTEGHGERPARSMNTSNLAEYWGLEIALAHASEQFGTDHELVVYGDSNLVVQHVQGKWKCRKSHLRKRLKSVLSALSKFKRYTIAHIPRELNREADELARRS